MRRKEYMFSKHLFVVCVCLPYPAFVKITVKKKKVLNFDIYILGSRVSHLQLCARVSYDASQFLKTKMSLTLLIKLYISTPKKTLFSYLRQTSSICISSQQVLTSSVFSTHKISLLYGSFTSFGFHHLCFSSSCGHWWGLIS